jgi:hypothetical protein
MLIFVDGRLSGLESNKITLTDMGLTLVRVSNSQLRQSLFFRYVLVSSLFFYKVLSRNHVFSKPFFLFIQRLGYLQSALNPSRSLEPKAADNARCLLGTCGFKFSRY